MNGDSLWRIAERQLPPGTTEDDIQQAVDALYQANASIIGTDPDLLHPKTQLNIPDGTP